MMYPMVLKIDPFLGEVWRELTPAEYDEKIVWFREYIKSNESDKARRMQEYISYLKRWFGDGPATACQTSKHGTISINSQ